MRLVAAIGFILLHQIGGYSADNEKPSQRARIAALIRELGHDRYVRRLEATRALSAMGEEALPPLRAAVESTRDIEVRRRAMLAIDRILDRARHSESTKLELIVINPGKFHMGSPPNEPGRQPEESQHQVRITRQFLLGKYEVTQGEYETIIGTNPSRFNKLTDQQKKDPKQDIRRFPVEQVSWFDAIEFCNRLSQRDGYKPYYSMRTVKRDGNSITNAVVDITGGNGYRLPTEAEWEFACRATTITRFHFGLRNNGKQANVKATRRVGAYGTSTIGWTDLRSTVQVGRYPPNRWGLYDTCGNVAEWVQDWYDRDYYKTSPAADPTGPKSSRHRIQRGGSWLVPEASARSASRFYQTPDERRNYVGFRVARTP